MNCPSCAAHLDAKPLESALAWTCDACHGVLIRRAVLHRHLDVEAVAGLWRRALASRASTGRRCCACEEPLRTWNEVAGSLVLALDACPACRLVWLDAGEIEKLADLARADPPRAPAAGRAAGADAPGARPAYLLGDLLVGVVEIVAEVADW